MRVKDHKAPIDHTEIKFHLVPSNDLPHKAYNRTENFMKYIRKIILYIIIYSLQTTIHHQLCWLSDEFFFGGAQINKQI